MHMRPPHTVGHQRMVESVEDILEQAPALLGDFTFGQREHGGEQVAIGPLIVTGHRFQNFAVGHSNTFHTVEEMPAVERTELPIATLLPIENSIRMCHFRGLHRLLVAFCASGFWVNYTTNMSGFEFRPGQL